MQSTCQIVWVIHGSPIVDKCSDGEGLCYVCTAPVLRGMPVQKWLGSNYTDQNRARVPNASHVCEACCYVHARNSPVIGRPAKEGKKFGGNFRNYSHCWEGGEYFNASKGEKTLIRAFIERDHTAPWFAAIADSGQKHVLPFAMMNGPGRAGMIQFDDQAIAVPADTLLISDMCAALTCGLTKAELERGEYRPRSFRELRKELDTFEQSHGDERSSGWFTLALWLAQRDEEEHARRQAEKDARNASSGASARVPRSVPKGAKRKRGTKVLGAGPEPSQSSGAADSECQRVGESGAKAPTGAGPSQLGIPGID